MPIKNFFLMLLSFALGGLVGYYFLQGRGCNSRFKYIDSSFSCGHKYVVNKAQYDVFHDTLEKYIQEQRNVGKILDIGLYFRDLDSGPTFGINQDKKFVPASLLKLPLAMTYYKFTEQNPSLDVLNKKIGYRMASQQEVSEFEQLFKPKESTKPDVLYTVKDMLYYSLAESDNRATETLKDNLKELSKDDNLFLNTYSELGLTVSPDDSKDDISARGYSSLLRQLYKSSYLSEESSEELLSILSKTSFNSGLTGGVPGDIEVAHKFGERFGLMSGQKQLHDCGIIYYPGNPYLLCIMTKGFDYNDMAGVISKISEMVYKEFDGRKL